MSELVRDAINDLKNGKFILVCDAIDRENEADLIMPAELVETSHVNFMINHAKGLICVPMSESWAKKLALDLMIKENIGTLNTAFTVSVDAINGTTSGISSKDRALTIKLLAQNTSVSTDFERPGHVFPLIAHEDGLSIRKGHTEASVELMKLAKLNPVAVICETLDEEGNPLKGKTLMDFASKHQIKIISIEMIMDYLKLSI